MPAGIILKRFRLSPDGDPARANLAGGAAFRAAGAFFPGIQAEGKNAPGRRLLLLAAPAKGKLFCPFFLLPAPDRGQGCFPCPPRH
jgi:hypothetical protein